MLEPAQFDALILAAKSGDKSALSRLVEEFEPEIRLIARRRLGKELRPFLDSVDLVQSVHRSLLVGLRGDRFDLSTPASLLALSATIIQRKVAKQWRKLQRQKRMETEDPRSITEVLLSLQADVEDSTKQSQIRDAVERILSELDPVERKLIEMRLLGYTTAEVAQALELDSDVLRVRLSRLRKRLKDRGLLNDWL